MLSLDMDLDVAVVYIAGFGVSERSAYIRIIIIFRENNCDMSDVVLFV